MNKSNEMGATDNPQNPRNREPSLTSRQKGIKPQSSSASASASSSTTKNVASSPSSPTPAASTTSLFPAEPSVPYVTAQDLKPSFATDDPKFWAEKGTTNTGFKQASTIMMRNKPVAFSMMTTNMPTEEEESSVAREVAQSKENRTYRVWDPQQQIRRNSLAVRIGKERQAKNDVMFEASQIRNKSYKDWRKDAKANLPSNSGGPPIEKLTDVLHAAPHLTREKDPRKIERALRRLSNESDESKPVIANRLPKFRDYSKARDHWFGDSDERNKNNLEARLQIHDDEDDDEDNYLDDRERLAEYQRIQAGINIKEKMNTLKYIADHLSLKRITRHELVEMATGNTVLDNEAIPAREHFLYFLENLGDFFHDLFTKLSLWDGYIKEIYAKYGVVNGSYFVWLRQLILLEVVSFLLMFFIVILPQMISHHTQKTPKPINLPYGQQPHFRFSTLLTGEGYLHDSLMYYSGYDYIGTVNEEDSDLFDKPAFRLLFVILLMFILTTIFIFSKLKKYYHSARMESTVAEVANMDTFKTVLCGWDFSCRDPNAKNLLHKTIGREMRILARMTRSHEEPEVTLVQIELENKKLLAFAVKHFGLVWGPWAIHILGNVLIIVSCILLGVCLLFLCKFKLFYYLTCVSYRDDGIYRRLSHPLLCPNGKEHLSNWILSLPTLFSSFTTLLMTRFIILIGDIETFTSPERKIYATMIKAGLFYVTNTSVLYTFWLQAKPELNREGFVAETIFGKELYRLVVIQGVMEVTLNFVFTGLYHLIRRRSKNYQKPEFRSENYCLSMFYIHTLSRIGSLFCPPLGFFVILRLTVDFFKNKFILTHLSSSESYSVHVSHMYGPFMMTFFLLSYLLSTFMNGYYLSETIPSNYDGPFEIYNKSYDEVLGNLLAMSPSTYWLIYLVKPACLFIILTLLVALLFFVRKWALAYEPIIVQLNDHILYERGDRDLLLKAIYEIGQMPEHLHRADGDIPYFPRRHAFLVAPTGDELFGGEDNEADENDSDEEVNHHIDEIIHHVQGRKTLHPDGHLHLHNLQQHFHDHHFRHHHVTKHHHDKNDHHHHLHHRHSSSSKARSDSLKGPSENQMQLADLVSRLVEARRKRSFELHFKDSHQNRQSVSHNKEPQREQENPPPPLLPKITESSRSITLSDKKTSSVKKDGAATRANRKVHTTDTNTKKS